MIMNEARFTGLTQLSNTSSNRNPMKLNEFREIVGKRTLDHPIWKYKYHVDPVDMENEADAIAINAIGNVIDELLACVDVLRASNVGHHEECMQDRYDEEPKICECGYIERRDAITALDRKLETV